MWNSNKSVVRVRSIAIACVANAMKYIYSCVTKATLAQQQQENFLHSSLNLRAPRYRNMGLREARKFLFYD